ALAWGAEMERRGAHTAEDTAREYYESAFYLVLIAAAYSAEDANAVAKGLPFALYDQLVKTAAPVVKREQNGTRLINYLGVRGIAKKLRDLLEGDTKRAGWKKDFEPR